MPAKIFETDQDLPRRKKVGLPAIQDNGLRGLSQGLGVPRIGGKVGGGPRVPSPGQPSAPGVVTTGPGSAEERSAIEAAPTLTDRAEEIKRRYQAKYGVAPADVLRALDDAARTITGSEDEIVEVVAYFFQRGPGKGATVGEGEQPKTVTGDGDVAGPAVEAEKEAQLAAEAQEREKKKGVRPGFDPERQLPMTMEEAYIVLQTPSPAGAYVDAKGAIWVVDASFKEGARAPSASELSDFQRWSSAIKIAEQVFEKGIQRQFDLDVAAAKTSGDLRVAKATHDFNVALAEKNSAFTALQADLQRRFTENQSLLDRALSARNLDATIEYQRLGRELERERLGLDKQMFQVQFFLALASNPLLLRTLQSQGLLGPLTAGLGIDFSKLQLTAPGGAGRARVEAV